MGFHKNTIWYQWSWSIATNTLLVIRQLKWSELRCDPIILEASITSAPTPFSPKSVCNIADTSACDQATPLHQSAVICLTTTTLDQTDFLLRIILYNETGVLHISMLYPYGSACFSLGCRGGWKFGLCSGGISDVMHRRCANFQCVVADVNKPIPDFIVVKCVSVADDQPWQCDYFLMYCEIMSLAVVNKWSLFIRKPQYINTSLVRNYTNDTRA